MILLKPGCLDDAEMAIMRRHPLIGEQILRDSQSKVIQAAALIALRHHERWTAAATRMDWKGEQIPLVARIVAVADVFDALTTERPYHPAWGIEEACDYLQQHSGTLFDSNCVRVKSALAEAGGGSGNPAGAGAVRQRWLRRWHGFRALHGNLDRIHSAASIKLL